MEVWGAGTLNASVEAAVNRIKDGNVQILWQTGKAYFEHCNAVAKGISQIKALQFIDRMDYAYACADVIISRAGALSISELQLLGKPVILVPRPMLPKTIKLITPWRWLIKMPP